jgi:hypothetical protein
MYQAIELSSTTLLGMFTVIDAMLSPVKNF